MLGIGLIIALGISMAVFAYMAFVVEQGNTVWKMISLIMIMIFLVLMAKASMDAQKVCEIQGAVLVCIDGPLTTAVTFYRITLTLMYLFFAYIIVLLFIQAIDYLRKTNKL